MIIDGEKYACDACVRGHRVSNCQHSERRLNHINKKGRPVTQCPHCRSLRKSRASHVRCECGDKPHSKEDCPHLKQDKGEAPKGHVCCCSHGQRCSCALKKELHLDSVPETAAAGCCSSDPTDKPAKPRLPTSHSDAAATTPMTVFANGHHKPCHSKNHEASHQRGVPYKIPRPHSIHGHQNLAHRSMDHLPSSGSAEPGYNHLLDSLRSEQQRQIKSESGSPAPIMRQRSRTLNSHLQGLNVSYTPFDLSSPNSPALNDFGASPAFLSSLNTTTSLPMDDQIPALSAASENQPPVDWAQLFGTPISQQAPFGNTGGLQESYMMAPTSNPGVMAHPMEPQTSSSGFVSEVGDSAAASYPVSNHGFPEPPSYAQSLPDHSRPQLYRARSNSSFGQAGPSSGPLNPTIPDHTSPPSAFPEMPPGLEMDSLVPGSTTSLSEIDRSSSGTGSPIGAGSTLLDTLQPSHQHQHHQHHQHTLPTIHGFSVQDAQKLAHPAPLAGFGITGQSVFSQSFEAEKPASPWATVHDESITAFDPNENFGGDAVWNP